jgi:peptidoglycan/LPS O-acetylase OafA/YrhL
MDNFYDLLTKKRMQIFGFAIIWIFFRHTYFYNDFSFGYLQPIIQIGDMGVDLFLFLSGFGLFFSYPKYTLKEFYIKRTLRILPMFIILMILFTIIENYNSVNNLVHSLISPVNWFILFACKYWFIADILLLYFLYPIIYKGICKYPILLIVSTIILCLLMLYIIPKYLYTIPFAGQFVVYAARFPIFIVGSLFAKKIDLFDKKWLLFILFLVSIPLLIYLPKDYQRMAYGLTTLAIIRILPFVFDIMPSAINKIFAFIGKISLEFYLVHIFLFSHNILEIINAKVNSEILTVLIVFIPTLIGGYLAHLVINQIVNLIKNRLERKRII